MSQNTNTQSRIIRMPDVIKTTGLGRSTIYSLIKDQQFPKPINLGARCVGWVESEINDWINSRIEESRNNG